MNLPLMINVSAKYKHLTIEDMESSALRASTARSTGLDSGVDGAGAGVAAGGAGVAVGAEAPSVASPAAASTT